MNPLHHLSSVELEQWPELYRSAVVAGSGVMLDAEEEGIAAADELVALTLPLLVRLGASALLADSALRAPRECATALARESAGVLRLLDRALAAHGRDNGYGAPAWLEHAYRAAYSAAGAVSGLEAEEMPLSTVVEATAEAAGSAVIALHRDRLGVPEALAEGLGLILVVRVAATAEGG
jgi:hypothetical protein